MLDFHRELLADSARTLAFRDAIDRLVRPGDVVVDLGSGSGILAFFAARAGASRVYAIEKQCTADMAALLARHNHLADRITFIHEYSLHANIPERANVLITETLGTFGFEEQILGLTHDARERYLAPGATIIPSRIVFTAVPVELPGVHARHIGWWKEPRYGLDLAPLGTFASNVIYAANIDASAYLASPVSLIDVALPSIETTDAAGQAVFTASREGLLHGFGGWFTATLADGITVSNATPGATHWQQAYFPLETPVAVARGARVELALQTHDGRAWRWRGTAAGTEFDQTTWLSAPPCTLLAT
jgi:Ribosomal protein L11 methyltransferase (PrmA)